MTYCISIPDNEYAFYAYINLVINNKNNANIPNEVDERPKKVGPVHVTYKRNEVNEPFMCVENLKDSKFLEMIVNQFCLLRSHWNMINSLVQYENSDRF